MLPRVGAARGLFFSRIDKQQPPAALWNQAVNVYRISSIWTLDWTSPARAARRMERHAPRRTAHRAHAARSPRAAPIACTDVGPYMNMNMNLSSGKFARVCRVGA